MTEERKVGEMNNRELFEMVLQEDAKWGPYAFGEKYLDGSCREELLTFARIEAAMKQGEKIADYVDKVMKSVRELAKGMDNLKLLIEAAPKPSGLILPNH